MTFLESPTTDLQITEFATNFPYDRHARGGYHRLIIDRPDFSIYNPPDYTSPRSKSRECSFTLFTHDDTETPQGKSHVN